MINKFKSPVFYKKILIYFLISSFISPVSFANTLNQKSSSEIDIQVPTNFESNDQTPRQNREMALAYFRILVLLNKLQSENKYFTIDLRKMKFPSVREKSSFMYGAMALPLLTLDLIFIIDARDQGIPLEKTKFNMITRYLGRGLLAYQLYVYLKKTTVDNEMNESFLNLAIQNDRLDQLFNQQTEIYSAIFNLDTKQSEIIKKDLKEQWKRNVNSFLANTSSDKFFKSYSPEELSNKHMCDRFDGCVNTDKLKEIPLLLPDTEKILLENHWVNISDINAAKSAWNAILSNSQSAGTDKLIKSQAVKDYTLSSFSIELAKHDLSIMEQIINDRGFENSISESNSNNQAVSEISNSTFNQLKEAIAVLREKIAAADEIQKFQADVEKAER